MPRPTNAKVRDKERRAVALHLEGKKFGSSKTSQKQSDTRAVALHIPYTAVMRAIKRDTVADIARFVTSSSPVSMRSSSLSGASQWKALSSSSSWSRSRRWHCGQAAGHQSEDR